MRSYKNFYTFGVYSFFQADLCSENNSFKKMKERRIFLKMPFISITPTRNQVNNKLKFKSISILLRKHIQTKLWVNGSANFYFPLKEGGSVFFPQAAMECFWYLMTKLSTLIHPNNLQVIYPALILVRLLWKARLISKVTLADIIILYQVAMAWAMTIIFGHFYTTPHIT